MADETDPAMGIRVVELLSDDVALDADAFRAKWGRAFLLVESALSPSPFDLDGTLPGDEREAKVAPPPAADASVFAVRRRVAQAGRPLTLGRTVATDVVMQDRSVSKLHAFLVLEDDGRMRVQDAGSKNGTYKDGVRLAPPPRAAAIHLEPGDAVQFGTVRARYVDVDNLRAWLGAHPLRAVPVGMTRVERPVGEQSGQHVFAAAVAALDAVAKFRDQGVELRIPGGTKTLTDVEVPLVTPPSGEHE
jgi:hypothetical protein